MPTAPVGQSFEKRDPIKAGTYAARCYSVVIMGTFEEMYLNETKQQVKVRITWELPTEIITYKKKLEDGTEEEVTAPSVIGKEYTFSMGPKANLRKMVESMITPLSDGEAEAFEIYDLVGVECMIAVGHKQKKDGTGSYAVIQSIMPMMKGMQVPPQVNPPVMFYYKNWNQEVYNNLPKFIRERIDESIERKHPGEDLMSATKLPF